MTDPTRMIHARGSWSEMRAGFRWPKPVRFNIAEMCCERWARTQPQRVAMTYLRPDGETRDYTFAQLSRASSRLANALAARGLRRGDRCALLLPQTPEALLTHLACYKLGAIVVPLFTLFGADGLQFRLHAAGCSHLVTDREGVEKIETIRDQLPLLRVVYSIDERISGTYGFWQELGKAADACPVADTTRDDPAFISFTSGTTGPPKGALHGHRVLLGHLPAIELHHDFPPKPGDRMWTPADWAWMGGLMNALLPSLWYGVPVVAHRMAKFDPDHAFHILNVMGVRNAFLPPTALKLMHQTSASASLRTVGSAGEALGTDLTEWGQWALGTTINEFYGQTECNAVLSNAHTVYAPKPGSTGRAVPGHDVAVLSTEGHPLPPGKPGEIGIRKGSMSMFLEYWGRPDKTEEKFKGDWMLTGDEAVQDDDGHIWFRSRQDDVITSSGYRIGPSEIEDCINQHPDVAMSAVVGIPDPVRTEIVVAYVVPMAGRMRNALANDLITRVRERISPHVAPRDIRFLDDLPMTATGKIRRRDLRAQADTV
ncbi:MAG: AMP-binding protein [Pseudomonadota bacterium]